MSCSSASHTNTALGVQGCGLRAAVYWPATCSGAGMLLLGAPGLVLLAALLIVLAQQQVVIEAKRRCAQASIQDHPAG